MRYKPEHKQATHTRILAAAMGLFRHEGIAGASVERVMRAAGLTVGGFYSHFASKEALVAEALRTLLRRYREGWLAGLETLSGEAWLSHFVHRYLNPHRRDSPDGCAMPTILSELTRSEPPVQAVLVEGLEAVLQEMEAHLPPRPGVTARQQALATLALMFGTLTLSRAASSQALSDELLEASRAFVLRAGEGGKR
ncbi:TetR/AcrR family transcriptional regulator [Myxococcaceae bacterium GXIMD 01537]